MGMTCECGGGFNFLNINNYSSPYLLTHFSDCLEHSDAITPSDVSYFNEVNFFDCLDSSSVADYTSAEQAMIISSSNPSAGTGYGFFTKNCLEQMEQSHLESPVPKTTDHPEIS